MGALLTHLKNDFIGYITLILMGWFIVSSGMFTLFIFLLFIYLATEVVTKDLRRLIPFVPAWILFAAFYIMLISFFLFFSFHIVPLFVSDASHYFDLIWKDIQTLSTNLSVKYNISIDLSILKDNALLEGTKSVGRVIRFFNDVTKQIIYFVFALALNLLLFSENDPIKKVFMHKPDSMLAYQYQFVMTRIQRFYTYFRQVMGGQVIISFINLLITMIVVSILNLPHQITLYCLVFFFGLLPVVGNLISNTILTVTALASTGVLAAVICLGLLVGIHKLEYFLNSKIIGSIIRLPMFITLLSLLLGEALLGLWGMIIAIPFFLTVKDELEMTDYH